MRQTPSKALWLIGALLISACKQETATQKARAEIAGLDRKDMLFAVNMKLAQNHLGYAYIEDGRADDALELYTQMIDEYDGGGNGILKIREYKKVTGKHDLDSLLSSSLAVQADNYGGLAAALKLKNDGARSEAAGKKATQLRIEAAKLKGSAETDKTAALDRLLKR